MATAFQIVKQTERNWCWAAVTSTVLRYFALANALDQCRVAGRVVGTDCCGAPSACDRAEALETALDSVNAVIPRPLNNQPLPGRVLQFQEIRDQIDSHRPVCVRIQWFGDSGGHFVMISGYSVSESGDGWVDVADPATDDSTIPYDQFVNSYLEAGYWSDTYLVGQP